MSTVLFVKANNRPAELAVSVKLYDAFLASYRESHPGDTIVELDLFAAESPYLNAAMINAFFKPGRGLELTREEQRSLEIADGYLNPFLQADKVVFAFPLWNLTVPAVLHTYMDYLVRAGKTFRYTPEGPVGLIPDKKAAILNARGAFTAREKAR
ncbi:FMN-dependent NADH-azoreductase [Paenibacillus sp. P25]|nr:FMN-dependent NADH-azoreductase [Paenibacillus sp. P25]